MPKRFLPLITGLAALGAGAAYLLRKNSLQERETEKSKPVRMGTGEFDRSERWVPPPAPESCIRERKPLENKVTGTVSFFAGIAQPKTYELSIRYDDFRYEWQLHEEYFRVPTSATHVGFVFGEDVSLQLEIPDFLSVASFEELKERCGEKFGEVSPVSYGNWTGFTYVDGDILKAALELPDALDCYLLVSIIKEHKSDMDFRELGGCIDVIEMLSSIEII